MYSYKLILKLRRHYLDEDKRKLSTVDKVSLSSKYSFLRDGIRFGDLEAWQSARRTAWGNDAWSACLGEGFVGLCI
jgi:hypothetical protein